VIEIFDRVQKKVPSRLLLMGDGPERSRAEWLVNQKGLRNRVEFLGKVDRVYEKLSIADLMLVPSEMESFGLSALEAMACEVPAIATSVGGVPEVVDHERSGYLAEVGDVETMARYAIDVLSDEKRLREMGKVARWEAQTRFCSTRIIPEYEKFYERVLERAA
jgi:N-acetyl-alpha-D-glucosaminyl L-malate synthase BshA